MIKVIVNGRNVDELTAAEKQASEERWRAKLEDLLSARRGPGLKTSSTRCAGVGKLADQFTCKAELDWYVNRCRQLGGTPHENDIYLAHIAEQPGDPAAFVPQADVESRVRTVCEERGYQATGDVKVSGRDLSEVKEINARRGGAVTATKPKGRKTPAAKKPARSPRKRT